MNKYNIKIETRIIRTILDGNDKKRSIILSKVSPEHFGYEYTRDVFERLMALMERAKDVPSSKTLKHDPILSNEAKNIVRTKLDLLSYSDIDSALDTLEQYRKARVQTKGVEQVLRYIEKMKVDRAELALENTLFASHSVSTGNLIHNEEIGEIAESILRQKHPAKFKTGIDAFDNRSGGFPKKGVVVLSAPSGGLKTALALWMSTNQYLKFEYEPAFISLEMSKEEIIERQAACMAGVDFNKIQLRVMSNKEKERIRDFYRLFNKVKQKTGKRYTIYAPDDDVTLIQLLNQVRPFNHNLIYIDYITLLNNNKDTSDWQHLRDSTRLAKRMAQKLKCTIVILAQLDEDTGKLRYSGGIKENVDLWFRWIATEADKSNGFMTIEQGKARNGVPFPFRLGINPSRMNFFNLDEDKAYVTENKVDKRTENKARKKFKPLDNELDMEENEEF